MFNDEVFSVTDTNGIFEFTFHKSALDVFDIRKEPSWENMHQHQLHRFLHNPKGPAIKHIERGDEFHYLDGIPVDKEKLNLKGE